MKIRTFFYTLSQGIRNLFKNGWYSLASIATISACLFLFCIFYSVVANLRFVLNNVEQGISVQCFFNDDVSEERILEIRKEVENRVEVSRVIYHTDEEIWASFGPVYAGEEYMNPDVFPENPLAGEHNLEIFLSDVSMQSTLVTWLSSMSEVRKVNYSEITATTLSGVNMIIAYISIGIIVILLAVSIFLINNTVRVGIAVRAEEINIMKYVGATDFFARAPFVLEGMIIGALGAGIPLALTYNLYDYVLEYINGRFSVLSGILTFLSLDQVFSVLLPVCMIVGVGIGFIGSFVTAHKHLRV